MARIQVNHGSQLFLSKTNAHVVIQDIKGEDWSFVDSYGTPVTPSNLSSTVAVRIIHALTQMCIEPQQCLPLDGGRVFLAPVQMTNNCQLWYFLPIPSQSNWFYIENFTAHSQNLADKRCLDVCGEDTNSGVEIITYHKKRANCKTPGNQWW